LKQKLLTMASHAELAVNESIRALVERDHDLATRVRDSDNVLDQFEIEVDELAIHLLAKAPLASDLRFVTVAMKISQNLERVGDEATTISRRVLELNHEPPLKLTVEIPKMATLASQMLKGALDSFVEHVPQEARGIIPRD